MYGIVKQKIDFRLLKSHLILRTTMLFLNCIKMRACHPRVFETSLAKNRVFPKVESLQEMNESPEASLCPLQELLATTLSKRVRVVLLG